MNYWLVKQEPESYSWADFLRDGRAAWTGVRNYQARNNLRAMKLGDLVFFYHSVSEKQIVGIAKVAKSSYPDPTAEEVGWLCVDLVPHQTLAHPVTLAAIKADPALSTMPLLRQSRISVTPLTRSHYARVVKLAGGKPKQA
ncbi:MAG TPA: EVE domain-containing protein [Candidatus Saccharimonadales bacterium]|nr:EVE domain-containing protein [Candidatus Saccharimonadales bacterium]